VIEPRRKYEQRAILHLQHDLVGIRGGECSDRRPDDPRLRAWVVKVDGVSARACLQIVDAAQKVVRMTVDPV
jgi:hypothetical protein